MHNLHCLEMCSYQQMDVLSVPSRVRSCAFPHAGCEVSVLEGAMHSLQAEMC
jgi:hypothetical protein